MAKTPLDIQKVLLLISLFGLFITYGCISSSRVLFEEKNGAIELKAFDSYTPPMSFAGDGSSLTRETFNITIVDITSGEKTGCVGNGMQKDSLIWIYCDVGKPGQKDVTADIYRDGTFIGRLNKVLSWPSR